MLCSIICYGFFAILTSNYVWIKHRLQNGVSALQLLSFRYVAIPKSVFFGVWLRLCAFFIIWIIMNKERTAVFIGHSNCPLSAKAVIPYIEQEILNGVDTFLNGGQGSFDCACARAVHQLKAKYSKIKILIIQENCITKKWN